MSGREGESEGRVTLVTGAASGIGRATVERLTAEGGRVVAMDLTEEGLAWTVDDDRVEGLAGDVTRAADNEAAVARACEAFGRLDALVLNAGVPSLGGFEDVSTEDFERVLAVNVHGPVHGLRSALGALEQSPAPAVVVTASTSGLGGDPGMWAYNTAKGAAVNFVRSAAVSLAHRGIRVNGVCPGPTRTAMTAFIESAAPAEFEAMGRRIPLQRWGEAEEVAAVIGFLVSPAASFVTGVLVPVDCGMTAQTGQFLPPERLG